MCILPERTSACVRAYAREEREIAMQCVHDIDINIQCHTYDVTIQLCMPPKDEWVCNRCILLKKEHRQ